ncbi:MAG TPA: glycoside hydrolase family 19 protein [Bryobacteraceae bacterium]|nr:glycoside hydrolase family 19 protein [Bryobacteraceae bacterium]
MTDSENQSPAAPAITLEMVRKMFPATPPAPIAANLPLVLDALSEPGLNTPAMLLMALSTIRAETEGFEPIAEQPSKFNTSPGGRPFDLYDSRADLGNQGPPDGERYRGRGFIQLTGRANYQAHGAAIGMASRLVEEPDLANDPAIAAKLLASFLKSRQTRILAALQAGDLKAARRLVNGGSAGLDRFTDAYKTGEALLAAA